MSIWKFLGLDRSTGKATGSDRAETETVRRIVDELDQLDEDRARFLASFAYVLSRVAHADQEISDEETRKMEEIIASFGRLPEGQAILVVRIAKSQSLLFGGTEDYLVTREFKRLASREQRVELLDCLFAVSAADDAISGEEERQIRMIAGELGFTHQDYVDARSAYNDKRDVIRDLPKRNPPR